MPQVARTAEQIAVDAKIQKCKQLLRHLINSQKSLRLKQKAERERERRASKLTSLDETIAVTYGQLAGGVENVAEADGGGAEENAAVEDENISDVEGVEEGAAVDEPNAKRQRV